MNTGKRARRPHARDGASSVPSTFWAALAADSPRGRRKELAEHFGMTRVGFADWLQKLREGRCEQVERFLELASILGFNLVRTGSHDLWHEYPALRPFLEPETTLKSNAKEA